VKWFAVTGGGYAITDWKSPKYPGRNVHHSQADCCYSSITRPNGAVRPCDSVTTVVHCNGPWSGFQWHSRHRSLSRQCLFCVYRRSSRAM